MLKEFKTFVMRGNVVDLAVAVIIGGAFGTIVGQTQLTSESDDFVQLQGGDVPPVYQTTLTFDTQWSE